MRVYIALAFCFICMHCTASDTIKIGLRINNSEQFIFKVVHGNYKIFSGNNYLKTLKVNEKTMIRVFDENIIIQKEANKYFFPKDSIRFEPSDSNAHFSILQSSSNSTRNYMGHLYVNVKEEKLMLVNMLSMKYYLPGVIKAEIGNLFHPEFLKAIAIISRTYTVRNINKHKTDGYHLCDQTHCHVYLGRINEYDIKKAINATKGEILVDTGMHLIDAVYHSNSGGITSCSEWVWKSDFSYLKSVVDSFSNKGKHYMWEMVIEKSKWNQMLNNFNLVNTDLVSLNNLKRREYFDKKNNIKMVDVRYALGLKSSVFKIIYQGEKIMIEGRGYGHGVGLSQEGAYHMSHDGYSYDDILFFYYKDVTLTNFSEL